MNGSYQIVKGDATKPQMLDDSRIPVIPHVVNDIGRWGSGFVNAITARWGEGPRMAYIAWKRFDTDMDELELKNVERKYDLLLSTPFHFDLGNVQYIRVSVDDSNVYIANMVGQHQVRGMDDSGRPPIRYAALAKAMETVANRFSHSQKKYEIHAPKFGSDLSGGKWEFIEKLIQEIWVDAGLDVVVYEFDG